MSWFGLGEEVQGIGKGVASVTTGLQHLITGEIAPEMKEELQKIDNAFTIALAQAEAGIPWYKSSRSIVLMWLVLNTTVMMWASIAGAEFDEYWVKMLGTLTTTAVVAFFGSKGAEFWKHGRMK